MYLATDSSPVDLQSYELCSDMIDLVIDMTLTFSDEGNEYENSAVINLYNGMVLYLCAVNR